MGAFYRTCACMSSRLPYNEIGSGTGKLRRKCPAAVRALAVGMALGRKAGLCAVEYMRRERTGDAELAIMMREPSGSADFT